MLTFNVFVEKTFLKSFTVIYFFKTYLHLFVVLKTKNNFYLYICRANL